MFHEDENNNPRVVVIGGPNGAGKTTIANDLLPKLGVRTFVNADIIARGLSMFDSDSMAIQAGRIMLTRLKDLAANRSSFAFETTLSSRTFATWLRSLIADDYDFHLICIWIPSPDVSIKRITHRVSHGGHFVPDDIVKRRYVGAYRNFFSLYLPIPKTWTLLDNSTGSNYRPIASGGCDLETSVVNQPLWNQISQEFSNASSDTD